MLPTEPEAVILLWPFSDLLDMPNGIEVLITVDDLDNERAKIALDSLFVLASILGPSIAVSVEAGISTIVDGVD